jgi:hypothetical protein
LISKKQGGHDEQGCKGNDISFRHTYLFHFILLEKSDAQGAVIAKMQVITNI